MRSPEPDIDIDVDLRNPGQFFACCGILELAAQLWPGSEGWFVHTEAGAAFHMATGSGLDAPLAKIVRTLCGNEKLVTIALDDEGIENMQADRQPVTLMPP